MPSAVSAAQLANVEAVTPTEVGEARTRIERLVHAEAEVAEFAETGGRLPWRGVHRADLSPVEVRATVQLVAVWEQELAKLESVLCASGLRGGAMTMQEAGFVHLEQSWLSEAPMLLVNAISPLSFERILVTVLLERPFAHAVSRKSATS